jgi:hypothetical protein
MQLAHNQDQFKQTLEGMKSLAPTGPQAINLMTYSR